MNSLRCPSCGLLQFANVEACKRCGQPIFAQAAEASYAPNDYQAPYTPSAGYQPVYGGYRPNYQPGGYHNAATDDGPAKTAMILGILSLTVCGFFAPFAFFKGLKAKRRIEARPLEYGGESMATAGMVMGGISSFFLVVTIPLIAAIAIPNLLAARRYANEGAALSSLRMIVKAEEAYLESQGKYGNLQDLAAARLIAPELAGGARSGYRFEIIVRDTDTAYGESPHFEVTANPLVKQGLGQTGTRAFYADETGKIHKSNRITAPATANDPVLER
jgi:type II secretory pathway pseudopilin PulG